MNNRWLSVALLWALVGGMACFARGSDRVSGEQARQLVAQGALLVDVRTELEFKAQHLEGARNLPVQVLGERLTELPKDKALVLYCRSGSRSASAARLLKENGFTQVHDLGAMSNW